MWGERLSSGAVEAVHIRGAQLVLRGEAFTIHASQIGWPTATRAIRETGTYCCLGTQGRTDIFS